MKVTFMGKEVALGGEDPKIGQQAPTFRLQNLNDEVVQLSDLLQKPLLISVVPDITTSVCSLQTRRFNAEMTGHEEFHFLTISNNSKEEQVNWCAAEGLNLEMLHDTENTFGNAYGLFIPEMGVMARAIFVVDTNGIIQYEEIVPEIAQEPDYQKAIGALKQVK